MRDTKWKIIFVHCPAEKRAAVRAKSYGSTGQVDWPNSTGIITSLRGITGGSNS